MMRRGHSLNELMIAVSLSMVLMSLIFAIAVNLQGGSEKINRRVDQNSAAQATMAITRKSCSQPDMQPALLAR